MNKVVGENDVAAFNLLHVCIMRNDGLCLHLVAVTSSMLFIYVAANSCKQAPWFSYRGAITAPEVKRHARPPPPSGAPNAADAHAFHQYQTCSATQRSATATAGAATMKDDVTYCAARYTTDLHQRPVAVPSSRFQRQTASDTYAILQNC